ncbi:MAG: phosphatidylserine decarboxylase, partial [Oscillospiraceae bacterium]|nr:phosphatidylserine decarboxylase [Oscillospiraceae bacterium]
MKQRYRDGRLIEGEDGQERTLKRLYGTAPGRLLLKILTRPWISRLAGGFLSTRLSKGLIRSFIRKHSIDMSQFEAVDYRSYNEFFSRKIRPEARPVDPEPGHLISPCDSKLTALPITADTRLTLKQTEYSLSSLLRNEELAVAYAGGWALIFRLTVDDYHRYCYADSGEKGENVRIPGLLHTV